MRKKRPPGDTVHDGTVGAPPYRTLIVLDHPAQQFVPSFRRAADSEVIHLEVLYWDAHRHGHYDAHFGQNVQWDVDIHGGYSWHVPKGRGVGKALNTWRLLDQLCPAVVVSFGWATAVSRLAILWAIRTSTPLLLYGDTTWQSNEGSRFALLRPLLLRILFEFADGALSTGTFNREFYILHGMDPRRIHVGVCPVDIDAFRAARRQCAADREVVIGFAGKFIPRKGAGELIDALRLVRSGRHWRARLIGDGPLRNDLIAHVTASGLNDRVEFTGFVNTTVMPQALAACDIVVVPSHRDLRVLVAAEAMAAGSVVVVSSNTAVWGTGDLIEHGVTGMVYESGDPAALAEVLRELIARPELRDALRVSGMERVARYGPDTFTETLEKAIGRVLTE